MILVAVVMVVVLVGAFVLVRLTTNSSPAAQDGGQDGQSIKRPGHDHDTNMADPAPLQEADSGSPVIFAGQPVVEACNLLSLADLNRLGIYYASNSLPNTVNYERDYIASDGKATVHRSGIGFDTAEGISVNKCSYSFVDSTGDTSRNLLQIAVSQPTYTPNANTPIGFAAEPYVQKPNLGNVQVYSHRRSPTNPGDQDGDSVMRLGNLTVDISFTLTANGYANKLDDVGRTIARNIQDQVDHPTGLPTITYNSPAFPKSLAQPCPLLTPEVFASVYHTDASPLVVENPATAVGHTLFTGQDDQHLYNNVVMSCERGTGEDDKLSRKSVELTATSYLSDTPAKLEMDFLRQRQGGQPTATKIGDDSVVETNAMEATGAVAFRKGRFLFTLRIVDQNEYPHGIPPQLSNSMLLTVAQQIAQRFGNQN